MKSMRKGLVILLLTLALLSLFSVSAMAEPDSTGHRAVRSAVAPCQPSDARIASTLTSSRCAGVRKRSA